MSSHNQSGSDRPAPLTVRATVDRFFPDRGYGFAVSEGGANIFFRAEGGRRVTGTHDHPRLTREAHLPELRCGRFYSTPVIMRVVPGGKGPRAIYWGEIPRRTWLSDLMDREGGLAPFIGGEFHTFFTGSLEASTYHGTVVAADLTSSRLKVTLSNGRRRYLGGSWEFDEDTLEFEVMHPDTDDTRKTWYTDGSLELAVRHRARSGRNEYGERVDAEYQEHLRFYPPRKK